ncbi:hypothetical protein ACJIZ3_013104 [Penstemon smallii]|uniref:Cytochrome P450 n=1 Tax=Penstemon smallii TaxID=265156 RepID=A0ABD3UNX6_9LAMI
MRANTAEKWITEGAKRYGPASKLSLFGKPTVFIYGIAANKFVFTSDGTKLSNQQTESTKLILGDRCLLELSGEDHKRVRNALASFLKPDSNIQHNMFFLFGLERGARRDVFVEYFQQMLGGMWSLPINLAFTRFNQSLKASAKVQKLLKELICEKRNELEKGASSHQDLITCLLSIRGDDTKELVSEDEIIHNVLLIMIAGHDTSSVLINFIVRLLANDATVYEAVLRRRKKYSWRVAMEILRTIFGGFRKTLEDIEYEGYLIPKGWQVREAC